jgi:hypothetical protein
VGVVEPDGVFIFLGAVGDSAAGDRGRDVERRCDRGEHAVKAVKAVPPVRIVCGVLGHRDYPVRTVE